MQCFIYFLTKFFQNDYHLLESEFDKIIPFVPYFVYFYIIWYFMLVLVPYLLYIKDRLGFWRYYISYGLTIIMSGIIYLIYPTTLTRPRVIVSNISTFLLNIIYKLDTPAINLLPSMHCSFCFLFIFTTLSNKNIEKKYRFSILVLSIFIIASTVLIKQHILIDILTSFIISSFSFILVKFTKLDIKLIQSNLVK